MKTQKLILVAFLVTSLAFSSHGQQSTAGNYTYKSECMGVEMDGSQTVKAWGNGRNKHDAVEQAKKNAVRDVLFNGIIEGKQDCERRPLVSEVNAQAKYDSYFNSFFKDGGDFKHFISLKDERIFDKISRDKQKARQSVTHGLIVRVLRGELKERLIADGILK